MRIVFTIMLVLSLTLPLFKVKIDNSTDNTIDYIKEKVLDGNWGMIANEVIDITEKVLQKEKESKVGVFAKIKNSIISGYGVGFSSIGAAVVSWNNYRFNRFELVPSLPLFIILMILIQIFFHNYFYKKRNAILSVLNMLIALSIFGNCIRNENYSGYLFGILLFLLVQISYMVYFYWFPYKDVTIESDESQSS